ncbi:hypothetical protein PV371_38930 [Streptomyces sp. TX20-6-3]|uniref:hypothetical protein n=1 Tax=Streptomyces sp. TX20-6-3 TaxID=3028705 RepID=UPI0029A8743D|nr:hypothetical protein [Streptomyces sp. TX20-6-3]MDX2565479.1 hypothetical protein [Streptomyces sp. TX20-6-3]
MVTESSDLQNTAREALLSTIERAAKNVTNTEQIRNLAEAFSLLAKNDSGGHRLPE